MPKSRSLPLNAHLALLSGFCAALVVLWMLPVILAGFPYWLTELIPEAKLLKETGMLHADNMRLMPLIISWIHPLISWHNVTAWTTLSAIVSAIALIPWWWTVQRVFNVKIAWVSTCLLGLMPMYWIEALRFEGYPFAFLFLFLSFASFVYLYPQNKYVAVGVAGLFFGLVLASRDAFIGLLPWLVGAYVWNELHPLKKSWWRKLRFVRDRKVYAAGLGAAIFLGIAYLSFAFPLYPNALQKESIGEKIGVFLPSLDHSLPGEGHLYPDQYTYEFEREKFDEIVRERTENESFIERQQSANMRLLFGVTEKSFLASLKNSVWLFVNAFPPLFLQDTVGGAFLWIFIIPGGVFLYKKHRRLFFMSIGLWLSMEFFLRFILHFGRHHLMDISWMIALFAGAGVVVAADAVHEHWKKVPFRTVAALMMIFIGLQLVQTNRKQFAHLYSRSNYPVAFAASEVINALPDDAVIAHPRKRHLFYFTDREGVTLHRDTIDRLAEEGKLREPFDHYGVTHIIGFDEEQTEEIQRAVRRIEVVEISEGEGVELTPLKKFLLHVVR